MVVDLRTAVDIEQTSSRTPWARWIPPIHSTTGVAWSALSGSW
jgi:hypothetical protein